MYYVLKYLINLVCNILMEVSTYTDLKNIIKCVLLIISNSIINRNKIKVNQFFQLVSNAIFMLLIS